MLGRLETVNAMTRRAREVPAFVRTAFPSNVVGSVVTVQAYLVHFAWLHLLDLWHVTAGVVVDVCLPGSMTALAAVGGRGRSWVLCLRVGRALKPRTLFFVTLEALCGPDVTPSSRLRRGWFLSRCLRRRRLGSGRLGSRLTRRAEGNRSSSTNGDCRSENARRYETQPIMHGDSPYTNASRARSHSGLPSSFGRLLRTQAQCRQHAPCQLVRIAASAGKFSRRKNF